MSRERPLDNLAGDPLDTVVQFVEEIGTGVQGEEVPSGQHLHHESSAGEPGPPGQHVGGDGGILHRAPGQPTAFAVGGSGT